MKFTIKISLKGNAPDFGLGPGVVGTAQLEVECERPTNGYDAFRLLETIEHHALSELEKLIEVTATDEDGKVIHVGIVRE